jgi:hypothetical protein
MHCGLLVDPGLAAMKKAPNETVARLQWARESLFQTVLVQIYIFFGPGIGKDLCNVLI